MHSTDEGSPSKKSKPDAAQLEEPHASAAAASREAERETVPEGEAADSLGSSIEVELPPQHQQPLAVAGRELNEPAPGSGDPWPGAVAALGGSEEAHLRRAEQRRADLEAAMEGAHFGGKELEEATGANVELVQTFSRDEAEEVAGADWPHLLGGGQEAALRERGERVMLEDRMLACSPSQLQGAQRRLLMDSGAHATWGGSGGEKSTARAELVVDGFVQPAQAMVFGTEDGTSADDVRGAAAAERRARWSLVVAHERSYADAMPQDGMGAEGATLSECPGGGGSLLGEEEVVRDAVHSAAEVRLRGVEAEMCRRRALQRLQLLRLRLAQEEEARRHEEEWRKMQEKEARERREREEEEARVLEASRKLQEEEEVLDVVALTAAALRALQLDRCRDSLRQGWGMLEIIFHRRQLCRSLPSALPCTHCQQNAQAQAQPVSPAPYARTHAPTVLLDHMLRILEQDLDASRSLHAARSLVQVVKAFGKLGALLNIRSEQARERKVGRSEMLRGQAALAESRFDDAYAYLSTALAAFRTAHALQSSAAAVDGAHSRGDNKGVCDGGRRGDGDGDAVVASGAGGALEGRARKESEGGPRADVEDSSRTVQDCDGEAMGDLLGGGFSNGELACEAEMRELAVLLEEVKQAEASALLRVAQEKVERAERMVEYMKGALTLGCRGSLLLQSVGATR
eukprot:Tamp_03444.p1 GENE.Tamp_03444~~Tamp_03444.p1  ORF type:complete len:720 (+),score=169.05 Tamp_03444:97-2160(+)